MDSKYFIAFDLGATSGRTILGTLTGDKLTLEEVTRFPNQMLQLNGHFYWNIFSLYENLKKGLAAVAQKKVSVTSIGIDTWGVDFAFVNEEGALIGLPYAYRDPQTIGKKEEFFEKVMPADELYGKTGIQHMDFNSIFQLYTLKQRKDFGLTHASRLLVEPEAKVGMLTEDLCEELQIESVPVIAVAGHDTASAVAAVPAANKNFAYLSSGTWSLMGIETDGPVVNEKTTHYNITNEGGVDGTIRLLKNITGMWIVEQCLKKWHKEGTDYTYPQMVELAQAARPFACFINPDDSGFTNPQDMPKAICEYCARTGQNAPQTHGEFIRVIFESLALKYREVLDVFRELSVNPIEKLHIIGGGSRNKLLNQFTSNAIGLPVVAGPSEASSIGNIMLQAKAAGVVSTLQEMRNVISVNVEPDYFSPADAEVWNEAYQKYISIIKK